jgi:hypothetical protein
MTSDCFQNKVCLKGTKISAYWRHKKKWRTESCSTTGIVGLSAQLLKGSTSKVTLRVRCKHTGMVTIKSLRGLRSHKS